MFDKLPVFLRVTDVALIANLDEGSVAEMIESGELPTYKLGTSIRVCRDGFLAWLERESAGALASC